MISLNFNPDHSRTLDRKVARIDVNVGSLLVTEVDEPVLIKAEETHDFDNVANLTLYSPNGAQCSIYYHDERVPAAVRGDSGGTGGSYESRTLTELRKTAKERGLKGLSKADKETVIEALRA